MDSNRRSFLRYFVPIAAAAPLALTAAADAKALILPPPPLHVPRRCSVVSARGPCVNFCAPHSHVCAAHDQKIGLRMVRAYSPVHDLFITTFEAWYASPAGPLPLPQGVDSAVVELGHGDSWSIDLGAQWSPLALNYVAPRIYRSNDEAAAAQLAEFLTPRRLTQIG
jgi:hypothetical protein